MKKIARFAGTLFLVLIAYTLPVYAEELLFEHEGERVSFDATAGQYTIYYYDYDGVLRSTQWVPADLVIANVKTKVKVKNGTIKYNYDIKVDKNSPQPLAGLRLIAASPESDSLEFPEQWRGSLSPLHTGNDDIKWANFRFFRQKAEDGVAAGKKVQDLSVAAHALPGMGDLKVIGSDSLLRYESGTSSLEVATFIETELQDKHGLGKNVTGIVPKIALPTSTSTDWHNTLSEIKSETELMAQNGYIDAVAGSEIVRDIDAAIYALEMDDMKSARKALQDARKHIKGHDDDMDLDFMGSNNAMAEYVLKFNLKYVRKHIKKSKDKHQEPVV